MKNKQSEVSQDGWRTSSFWQNTQHRKQDAVFLSKKNANTNAEPEISDHIISHLQVSQIPKIKSK